jgi:cytochrome c oxidase subunit 4
MNEAQEAHGHGAVATADADHAQVTPEEHGEHAHPGSAEYVRIAVILAAITAAEVAVYYFDLNKVTLVATLLIMSAAKFGLVAAFFMHLKFDSRVFSTFFAGGLVMAVAAFIAVLAMFRAF